ncbi:MAG: Ig-like domain-containing protein [Nanoarchaeota archaeon]
MSLKKNRKKQYRRFSLFFTALILGIFLSVVLLAIVPSISLAPSSAAPSSANAPASAEPGSVGFPNQDAYLPSQPTNLQEIKSYGNYYGSYTVLSWSPSIDDVGVDGYIIYQNGVEIGRNPSWATEFWASGTPDTTYSYAVSAFDASGKESIKSSTISAHMPLVETTPPTISLISPTDGSTVSGVAIINVSATDSSGISSVVFYVDDTLLSIYLNDTLASLNVFNYPVAGYQDGFYITGWDTTLVNAGGVYNVSVIAYDSSFNPSETVSANVTVDNSQTQTTPPSTCGDGFCDLGEDFSSCPADCSDKNIIPE